MDSQLDGGGTPGRPRPIGTLPVLAGLSPALILLAIFAVLIFGSPPGEVTFAAAVILASTVALILAGFNRITALFIAMGGAAGAVAVGVRWLLDDRAFGVALILGVVLGAAAVARAAYKESPRSTALGAVATGIARALLFGWSVVLLPLAFLLVFGNLLHILPAVTEDHSSDETWQEGVAMVLIAVTWFGAPAGAILGFIGWAFGRPSPAAGRQPQRGSPQP